jgi:hypothetical protein
MRGHGGRREEGSENGMVEKEGRRGGNTTT